MRKLFLVIAFSLFALFSSAQDLRLTSGPSTVKVISEAIGKQTDILFSFSHAVGNLPTPALDLNLKNATVEQICKAAFSEAGVKWKINETWWI